MRTRNEGRSTTSWSGIALVSFALVSCNTPNDALGSLGPSADEVTSGGSSAGEQSPATGTASSSGGDTSSTATESRAGASATGTAGGGRTGRIDGEGGEASTAAGGNGNAQGGNTSGGTSAASGAMAMAGSTSPDGGSMPPVVTAPELTLDYDQWCPDADLETVPGLRELRRRVLDSYAAWSDRLAESGPDYRFVGASVVPPQHCETAFEVDDGVLVRREQYVTGGAAGREEFDTFVETGDDVGDRAVTCVQSLAVSDLYLSCLRDVLCQPLETHQVHLDFSATGLLTNCVAHPDAGGESIGEFLGAVAFGADCEGGRLVSDPGHCDAGYCYELFDGGYCTGAGELPYDCPSGYDETTVCLKCGPLGGCGTHAPCAIPCTGSTHCTCVDRVCEAASVCF